VGGSFNSENDIYGNNGKHCYPSLFIVFVIAFTQLLAMVTSTIASRTSSARSASIA